MLAENRVSGYNSHLVDSGRTFGRRYVLDPVMLPRTLACAPTRALDVGCGEGRFCRLLRREDVDAVGLDPTPALLALDLPCSMEAKKTLFSPARPIAATWAFGSFNSCVISSAVSIAPLPCK